MKAILYTFWLILQSPATQTDKIETIFYLTQCEEVKTTCAIILFETGYLQAYKLKVDNAQKHNNIFGFRLRNRYLVFKSYSASVRYYMAWQGRHWTKFKRKYPNKSYYDFLKWVGYCNSMQNYIRTIKKIERQ